jgi:hypothetical protein
MRLAIKARQGLLVYLRFFITEWSYAEMLLKASHKMRKITVSDLVGDLSYGKLFFIFLPLCFKNANFCA